MNYQLRDRQKKDNGVFKIVLLFILIYGVYWLMGSFITNILHGMQKGVATFFGYYVDPIRPVSENALIKDLKRENASLKQLLGRVVTETVVDTGTTTASSTQIKEVKKVVNVPSTNTVLAVILARPPRTPYDSLLIDIGEDEGLVVGDEVFAERDYAIGSIVEVLKGTAVAKLYSAPDQKIDVLIGDSTIPVVAEGRGSGNFYIKVPKNISVHEGDQIIIPSMKNKVLGTAERVDSDEGDAYSHVYFKMPVHLYSLHYVQVKKSTR